MGKHIGDKTIQAANKAVKGRMSELKREEEIAKSAIRNPFTSLKGIKEQLPFKNSQVENRDKAYKKEIDKKVNIGEDGMFTGNAWFDTGLAMGRRAKKKREGKS